MINGPWAQWHGELTQHWQHALAAVSIVKDALAWPELLRYAIVATVTSVLMTQITLTEIKGELKSLVAQRDIIIKKRDEQIVELKRDVTAIETIISTQAAILSRLEARQADVMKRQDQMERRP